MNAQGCGVVEYEVPASACAAMAALHARHHWEGGETAMVVEWVDPTRYRPDINTGESDDSNDRACHACMLLF
jgi:hypothetical protein